MPSAKQRQQDELLLATLPHVPFEGWSLDAMRDGGKTLNLGLSDIQWLFPAGPADLARHFNDWVNRQMLKKLKGKKFSALKVREKIVTSIEARLEVLTPYKDAVRGLHRWLMLPANTPFGFKMLADTCHVIWNNAGDTAQDWNFYSKRLLLGGVYSSTLCYWFGDSSQNHERTSAFLQKRIDNVLKIGSYVGRFTSPRDKKTESAPAQP